MKKYIAVLLTAVICLSFFACKKEDSPIIPKASETTVTTTEPEPILNPLTGKKDYNEKAVGKRPVAVVVENTKPARPQWGISTPDIIVEGEVEGGISRMLWIYADYTALPEKIGPLRSARPSFVQFSEYFDAFYIHWGGSHSKKGSDYVGGYETIKKDGVNDLDGMNGGKLFGRDKTRNVSSEHTGIMHGELLPEIIKEKGWRTDIDNNKFTAFEFNDKAVELSADKADKASLTFSSRTYTRDFVYNKEDKKYHTTDWKKDVKFKNLIFLIGETKYITTPYKNSSTTYLNYALKGGTGYVVSNGTKIKINWSTDGGRLKLTDEAGKTVKLNPGKSYIGLASSNHEGKATFKVNE